MLHNGCGLLPMSVPESIPIEHGSKSSTFLFGIQTFVLLERPFQNPKHRKKVLKRISNLEPDMFRYNMSAADCYVL